MILPIDIGMKMPCPDAGNRNSGLGHHGQVAHSCAHRQCCQGELSHACLCLGAQAQHESHIQAGLHPQPI